MSLDLTNEDLKTMVSCVNRLVQKGYDHDFKVEENGKLKDLKTEKEYAPSEVHVINYFRFEGASDPADNSILYALESDDGARGTLVDAFGPYASRKVTYFMQQVEDLSKKAGGVHVSNEDIAAQRD